MNLIAFLLLCPTLFGPTPSMDAAIALYGHVPIVAVSGNGRVTAGVDTSGRVAVCRWPSPGAPDQLYFRQSLEDAEATIGHGMEWGIETESGTFWQSDSGWTASIAYDGIPGNGLISVVENERAGVGLSQLIYADPAHDVLTMEGQVAHGAVHALVWRGSFAPCTRSIPDWPLRDWLLDDSNGFVAYRNDAHTTVHFRPVDPGKVAWFQAREFARGDDPARWGSFGEGVWIACASRNGDATAAIAGERDEVGEGPYFGPATTAIRRVEPGGDGALVVHVAFGQTRDAALSELAWALAQPLNSMRAAKETAHAAWLADAVVPVGKDLSVSESALRCLLTMRMLSDRQSGVVVRGAETQPPLARDWPRDGMWTIYAFALGGYWDEAREHLAAYVSALRDGAQAPRGSMPVAIDVSGATAASPSLVDLRANASVLYGAWLLWTRAPAEQREAFIARFETSLAEATDFLASWSEEGRGEPWHGFNPAQLRDTRSRGDWLEVARGLNSAIALFTESGRENAIRPIWRIRLRECEVALLNLTAEGPIVWTMEESLPYGLDTIFPDGMPGVETSAALRVSALKGDALAPAEAARALAELAMLGGVYGPGREALREWAPVVLEMVTKAGESVDTVAAAQAYVAAVRAYRPDGDS